MSLRYVWLSILKDEVLVAGLENVDRVNCPISDKEQRGSQWEASAVSMLQLKQ